MALSNTQGQITTLGQVHIWLLKVMYQLTIIPEAINALDLYVNIKGSKLRHMPISYG